MINCLGEDVQIALTALGAGERERSLWTVCRGVGYGDMDVASKPGVRLTPRGVFKSSSGSQLTHTHTHLTCLFICSASILYHPSKWLSQISFNASLPKVVVVLTQRVFLGNFIFYKNTPFV